jgi:predicted glutamine amidotransferase
MKDFGDAIEGATTSEKNSFGEVKMDDVAAITLHTRMATSAKGMANTHPFVYENHDTSLIHNGVIRNEKDFKLQVSTCDSESILQAYLINETHHNPKMVGEMAKMLVGYYAAALFSRDADGVRILH